MEVAESSQRSHPAADTMDLGSKAVVKGVELHPLPQQMLPLGWVLFPVMAGCRLFTQIQHIWYSLARDEILEVEG